MFHRPGFGLLVSVSRSLSTQPPLATQALIVVKYGAGMWDGASVTVLPAAWMLSGSCVQSSVTG